MHERLEDMRPASAPSSHRNRVQVCNIILRYYGKPTLEVPKNRKVRRRVPQVLPLIKEKARAGDVYARIWLLSYSLGGVRYTDLVSLTKDNISNGYISYQQSKTGYNIALPLNEQALWCIHVLRGGEYLVPRKYMRNWKINRGLKEIHPLLQLHDARRMMAAELHKQGLPLATIQAIGGWSSVETAMLYCGNLPDSHLRDAVSRLGC
ncbi:MAG: tyrosine-type recombinase/integrase [Bacteroidetes bacterium]|nr:tyrosine-type recombinase/integrase [Bacteroidota bacterium]